MSRETQHVIRITVNMEKKNTTSLFFGRLDRLLGGAKHAMPSMKHIQRQAICDLRHIYTDSLQLCNIFLPLRNALTPVK